MLIQILKVVSYLLKFNIYTRRVNLKFLVIILSILIFIKTLSYGIFEIKENNKCGGITVIILSIVSLTLPNIMVWLRGF